MFQFILSFFTSREWRSRLENYFRRKTKIFKKTVAKKKDKYEGIMENFEVKDDLSALAYFDLQDRLQEIRILTNKIVEYQKNISVRPLSIANIKKFEALKNEFRNTLKFEN